jgi:hypothetical protein
MYCPQCATDNLDNASFCRGCGSNISLVPQALTGSLPAATNAEETDDDDCSWERRRNRKGKRPPSIEHAIKNIFSGIAFILVALSIRFFMPGGFGWWFWMLIPAFSMLGGGVAELVSIKMEKPSRLPAAPLPAARPLMPQARPSALPPQLNTAELIPQPHSVTEGTTRHLKTPVENKRTDA